jgi:hypothetical protein
MIFCLHRTWTIIAFWFMGGLGISNSVLKPTYNFHGEDPLAINVTGWKIDVYSSESHRTKWENNRINGGCSFATFDLPEGTLMGI